MPERPFAPEFVGWPRGVKADVGESLFRSNQIETHHALELITRGLRVALAHERDPASGAAGDSLSGFDSDTAGPDGSPGTNGMGPRGSFRWDGPPIPNVKPLPWGGPRRPDVAHLLR